MRKKTSNAHRSVVEIQRTRHDRVREDALRYGHSGKTDPISNAQRPTFNSPASLASTWKNDYWVSACGLSGWLMRSRTREQKTTLQASFSAVALRHMATTVKSKLPNPEKISYTN